MNAKKRQAAKDEGFTHIGTIYGYECFLVKEDLPDGQISVEIRGTSWFRRRMINFFAWIETRVYPVNNGFIIIEEEEL